MNCFLIYLLPFWNDVCHSSYHQRWLPFLPQFDHLYSFLEHKSYSRLEVGSVNQTALSLIDIQPMQRVVSFHQKANTYNACKLLQLCPALCDPMDHSPPGSSVHRVLQARILEWVTMPSSRAISNPGIKRASPVSPALAGRFFTTSATWEAPYVQ